MLFARTFSFNTRFFSTLTTTFLLVLASLAHGTDYTDWTWVSGNNKPNKLGIYGTQGTAAPGTTPLADATPSGRLGSAHWRDAEGNLWVFGGLQQGPVPSSTGLASDLWKFDPTTTVWTWMKGSSTPNQAGVYGTRGTAAPANMPGARQNAVSWTDAQGKLWLFGGNGYGTVSGSLGSLDDIWKYDPVTNNWTWVKGSNTINQPGIYGTQGQPGSDNTPGARYDSVGWTDAQGKLWLYGGFGYGSETTQGLLSDMWQYDPLSYNWTFYRGFSRLNEVGLYGTQGTEGSAARPGARQGAIRWTDAQGKLWLFGGLGYATGSTPGFLNDLWRFDTSSRRWTWMKGTNAINPTSTYGTQGAAAANNTPGAMIGGRGWTDAQGQLWLFGGFGYTASASRGHLDALWKYDPATNNWTWMKGSASHNQLGVYGFQGIPYHAYKPSARQFANSWTDLDGNLWLFGGNGYVASGGAFLNDLWKYDTATGNWTWMKGSSALNQPSVYDNQGVTENRVGSRRGSAGWTGADGTLWLFGGRGYGSTIEGLLNDLWKYNPATDKWVWMKGNVLANRIGTYGTQGVPNGSNTPGGRRWSTAWTDAVGSLWLFGGNGVPAAGAAGRLNDLWKFDPATSEWTWVKGSNAVDQPGVYGTQGVSDPGNTPGSRQSAAGWTEPTGNLWLFGGNMIQSGTVGQMNDLWKYDPTTGNWTWMKGSSSKDQVGTYGTIDTPNVTNTPGARENCVTWTDSAGHLWLFGGYGIGATAGVGYLNDLWKYNSATNQWAWISGSNTSNQTGTYGTQNYPAPGNIPGGRQSSTGWIDPQGHLWLLGGYGYATANLGQLNDVWKFDPATREWTWVRGHTGTSQIGVYGVRGTATPGSAPGARDGAISWTGPNHVLWLFGGTGLGATGSGHLNDLWKMDPLPNSSINIWGQY